MAEEIKDKYEVIKILGEGASASVTSCAIG